MPDLPHGTSPGAMAMNACRLAIASCLVLATFQAFGFDDVKYYMGSTCVPMDGRQWSRVDPYQGYIRNKAGSDTYVTCALPTDQQDDLDVPALAGLAIAFQTGAHAGTIACTAYTGGDFGGHSSSRTIVAGAADTHYAMEWGLDEIRRSYRAQTGVNCKLPAGTSLKSLVLREHDATGPTP